MLFAEAKSRGRVARALQSQGRYSEMTKAMDS
jgi:hypothetical protein